MGNITLRDSAGRAYDVPEADVPGYLSQGFTVETPAERVQPAIEAANEERFGGPVRAGLAAAGLGALGTVTGGLSDAALAAAGGREGLRTLKELHPIASTVGSLAGAIAPVGLAGVAGAARAGIAEQLGGGVLAHAAGGAAEGALYGAGQGVSELALSNDPLTAEHIASTLSSNMLLGGAIGGVAGGATAGIERGLARAGAALREASTARATLEALPSDLAGLDDAGLVAARKTAVTDHAADIAAERQSLEQLRVERRAELANEVRDLHNDLSMERPIFHAVSGDDAGAIAGVKDIRVQLAKSFSSMRSAFDNPIGVARDPFPLLKPLEQRQAALEALQAKAPELEAMFAGKADTARAAVLGHVDAALTETKGQIEAIKALSSKNPVSGARLSALESGPSARVQAIDAARDALKKGPELGLVGKAATGAAFAGGTALAHMIPGVGIAAPFVGKAASEAIESLFVRMAGGERAVAAKSSAAVDALLSTAKKAAPTIAPLASTAALERMRFARGQAAKSASLHDLFAARTNELRQQTQAAPDGSIQMRPEARQAITAQLAPVAAINPLLADKIETAVARRVAYMSSKIPKHPEVGGLQVGPDNWRPSDLQIRSWARTVRACEDPAGVEERLANGRITPEDAEAYRVCYPARFAALQAAIFQSAPALSKTLPTSKKVALYVFTGVPTMPALQPNVLKVLQSTFAVEAGTAGGTQAPKPMPAFGALGSARALDEPTPAQKRGG